MFGNCEYPRENTDQEYSQGTSGKNGQNSSEQYLDSKHRGKRKTIIIEFYECE